MQILEILNRIKHSMSIFLKCFITTICFPSADSWENIKCIFLFCIHTFKKYSLHVLSAKDTEVKGTDSEFKQKNKQLNFASVPIKNMPSGAWGSDGRERASKLSGSIREYFLKGVTFELNFKKRVRYSLRKGNQQRG